MLKIRSPLRPRLQNTNIVSRDRCLQQQATRPRDILKWSWIGFTGSVSAVVMLMMFDYLFPLERQPNTKRVPPNQSKESSFTQATSEFYALLGPGNICSKPFILISHSSTQWSPAPSTSVPSLVLYPRSTSDVSTIARICFAHSIPITPYSGGTSLEGALAASHGGVCIDFSKHMNRIIEVRPRDMDTTVQAGVCWQDLNAELEKHSDGLFFPPDPGPGACIGGMVATNCSGPNAYRYGTMKDWVVSLTVVLADGTVIKTRGELGRPRKTSAGYDLTRLFIGSSGTLGIVTEAVLKVTSRPRNERVAVAAFESAQTALNTVVRLVQKGVPLAAIEMLDEVHMYGVNRGGFTDRTWKETPTLFFKFDGPTIAGVREQIQLVREASYDHIDDGKGNGKCLSFDVAETEGEVESLWAARKTALWSFLALKDNPDVDEFVSSDVAVPISRLGDAIEFTQNRLKDGGMKGSIIAHAGDGNFHAAILYHPYQKPLAEQIITDIQRAGIAMSGTVSGEHGIGLTFRDILVEELGEETIDVMRRLKKALDPDCLLNCDKIFRSEKNSSATATSRSQESP